MIDLQRKRLNSEERNVIEWIKQCITNMYFSIVNRQYHDEINKKKIIYEKEKLDDQ